MPRGYANLAGVPGQDREPRIERRHWLLLVLLYAGLHFLALAVSVRTGNFDPNPNHDHVWVMC